jgi:Secretion system C-terminal sorting domain
LHTGCIPDDFSFDPETGILTGFPSSTGNFGCVILAKNLDYDLLTGILHSDIIVVLPSKIETQIKASDIKIFPNPCTSNFEIDIDLPNTKILNLEIFDAAGILIESRQVGNGLSNIDCSPYEKGIYLLKFTDAENTVIKIEKILKSN